MREAVQAALRTINAPRCTHVSNWPEAKHVRAGIIACPFCQVVALQRVIKTQEEFYEGTYRQFITAMERAERLNDANTALQRLAMDTCRTPEQFDELARINGAQYPEGPVMSQSQVTSTDAVRRDGQ